MNLALGLNVVSLQTLWHKLWPEYLVESSVVAICVLYVWAMVTSKISSNSPNLYIRTRLLSFVGLCATAALVFLGLLSPYYGVVAFFAVPAPILFVILAFRPALAWQRS